MSDTDSILAAQAWDLEHRLSGRKKFLVELIAARNYERENPDEYRRELEQAAKLVLGTEDYLVAGSVDWDERGVAVNLVASTFDASIILELASIAASLKELEETQGPDVADAMKTILANARA